MLHKDDLEWNLVTNSHALNKSIVKRGYTLWMDGGFDGPLTKGLLLHTDGFDN
jgi:hypothetical protein